MSERFSYLILGDDAPVFPCCEHCDHDREAITGHDDACPCQVLADFDASRHS